MKLTSDLPDQCQIIRLIRLCSEIFEREVGGVFYEMANVLSDKTFLSLEAVGLNSFGSLSIFVITFVLLLKFVEQACDVLKVLSKTHSTAIRSTGVNCHDNL
jgi:hypothetical protein